ncbi:hypothetical protein M758_7G062200 [Ceratodon purpureus]|nr:hypothetical protein M758_7G062200 [Ceratodon purpureus]
MANFGPRRAPSKSSSIAFLMLCIAHLCISSSDGDEPVCRGSPTACSVDDSLSWLSDLRLWNPGDKGSQVSRSVLNSWCNDTVQDAARHVLELEDNVSVLMKEKLTCQQTMIEKEKEWMEAESQLKLQLLREKRELQRLCMEKEMLLRVKLGGERDAVAADLAHCRAMGQVMISAEECSYQKQLVLSKCEAEWDAGQLGLQKELVDRSPDENSQLGSCADSDTQQQNRMRWLEESLGNCRFERAQAQAVVDIGPEVEDLQLEQLRRSIKILSTLLVLSVTLCFGLAAALAVWIVSTVKGERGEGSSKLSTAMLGTYPQVLSSEEARRTLASLFEESKGDLSSILTSPDSTTTNGADCVFLLVPLALDSARKFALFGGGGDFTKQVEVAQDLVAHQLGKRLVIVLYHSGGHAFTQKTLDSIEMTAEKLVFEAVPKDRDFPSDDDVFVLWLNERYELQVSDSGGESELSEVITQQSWAHYLENRAKL